MVAPSVTFYLPGFLMSLNSKPQKNICAIFNCQVIKMCGSGFKPVTGMRPLSRS
jgi:hypothetical protein